MQDLAPLHGIRIGVATIKAFLDVTNKKAVGISSLESLAYHVETDGTICSLIDAKNNNVYAGFFEKKNGIYTQIQDYMFSDIDTIIEMTKNKKYIFVGNGSRVYKDMLQSKVKNATWLELAPEDELNAVNIGKAAYAQKENATVSEHLKPIYLRKANAERQNENNKSIFEEK